MSEQLNITVKEILENNLELDPIALAQHFDLDWEETTSESNGYPANIKPVIVADTITELLELEEQLKNVGYEVEPITIYKKNGWNLWHREGWANLKIGYFKNYNSDAPYFDFDADNQTEEEIKKDLIQFMYGDTEELKVYAQEIFDNDSKERYDSLEEVIEELKEKAETYQLGYLREGKVRIYYTDNFDFDYEVNDESAVINYDSQYRKLALKIEWNSDEEE